MEVTQLGADLLEALRGKSWHIEPGASADSLLPADLQRRYPRAPAEVIAFLQSFDSVAQDKSAAAIDHRYP